MHDVRFFLKLCAYYKRFIENFALLTKLLYDLIKEAEDKKFKSVQMHFAARNAFIIIKNVMCSDRVLVQSNISLFFVIEIDVSDFGWKVVLYQADFDEMKRSVIFKSKTFFSTKRNYVIREHEFLIIKKNLRKWRCYIENDIIIIVRTNYAGLQHIKIIVKFSERLIKWLIEFEKYKLDIRYKFEIEMIVPNILSRRNDYKLRILEIDLRTINFDNVIIVYARDNILFDEIEWNISLKWFEDQLKMNDENQMYHRDSSIDNWMSYTSFWSRANILNVIHKSYEYCSTNIMFDIIRTKQWWFDMKKNIKKFVRNCSECQLTVKSRDIKRDEMHSFET